MTRGLANILTLSRIAAIPIVVGFMYFPGAGAAWTALILFCLAALTDWADGFVARNWQGESKLGSFLDPIADKLLVAAVLLMLVSQGRLPGLWILAGLIILCREILVSGLREYLAELRVSVPVSKLAKWKTAIQFIALSTLILGDHLLAVPYLRQIEPIGLYLLGIAAGLTVVTGYDYLRVGLRHMESE
ncbi:MAG: CDP-diacylglycerol--glycerol-3-phosphate 3-phosphatidyltransferase [Candidatus Pacebacteria bacterium]|nr:CDP-diacylglycerol--glycerol-3-phosphate 3-phosphatidyltransferase [Candidatus Paceibacterota bacterium]